jgi:sodium/proline symporter
MVAGAVYLKHLFHMSYTTALWLVLCNNQLCLYWWLLAISWTDTFQAGLMILRYLLTQS